MFYTKFITYVRLLLVLVPSLLILGCWNSEGDIPQEIMSKIEDQINKQIVSKVVLDSALEDLAEKLPLIKNYDKKINLLPVTKVYLYYPGLSSGGIWDKPGALAFGANLIKDISFSSGPIEANLYAHVELDGDRNYFFVETNDVSGWMGRPYINKDPNGQKFFMPNPLTSESIRDDKVFESIKILINYTSNRARFTPSFNEINWDSSIPLKYRQIGYEMYNSALEESYSKVDSLVEEYLRSNP